MTFHNPDHLISSPRPSTRLIDAVIDNDISFVAAMIKQGADLNARDAGNNTALIWAASEGRLTIAAMLLEAGADIDARCNYDRTALDWAERNRHPAVANLIKEEYARRHPPQDRHATVRKKAKNLPFGKKP